ncbi:PLD nuclease N-terminal domain-containing protein [Methanococcoides orientis]|uniref:PLD nuclease N-terminal domain-containing protein n=1 Tax=Methanococcoides orientis TaxID=2822137 RepID=UPI00217561F1|nr:PLD nuclease N-terminal domain-containing protein [Methanococcoides orientis]
MGQLLWGIAAIAIVFWLFMLFDCLQRSTENFPRTGEHEKLIWLIALVFLNFIGAILYYYMVKIQGNSLKKPEE